MRNKNVFSTLVAFAALGIGSGFSATGCSSDDDSSGTGGAAGSGTGGTGGTGAKGGTGGKAGGSGATGIDCKAPTGIQQCKDEAFRQGSCEEVGGCACVNCCQELQDCEADPGCVAIRTCANEKGCRGIGCYQDATCKAVIDANGGPTGIPATTGLTLSTCIEPKCPITKCGGSAGTGGTGSDGSAGTAGSGGGDASPG